MTFEEVERGLVAEIDEGLFATCGQLYVSQGGEALIDIAAGIDGLGREVNNDTLFAAYCSGKPAVALGIGDLIDDRELSLDDRVGDVLDRQLHPALCTLQISHLLSHTAGLHELDPHAYILASPRQAERMVLEAPPAAGWNSGQQVGYSQASAWYLLGAVIEEIAGESARTFVRHRVLIPAGVGDDLFVIGMDDEQYESHLSRIGVNVFFEGLESRPILTERTRRFRCRADPSLGTTTSARGLGRFYESLLRRLHAGPGGAGSARLEQFISEQSRGYDPHMQRDAAYGFGFMVGLEDHYFGGECSSSAFGHSANGGMTAAFADPVYELVVAFHFNGRIDADTSILFRRPALIDRVYRAALGRN